MTNVIKIRSDKLLTVLEKAKNLKTEYVLIPRNFWQYTYASSIVGISYGAIVVESRFYEFKDNENYYELWDDESLQWIAMQTKDINQFKQQHVAKYGNAPFKEYLDVYANSYVVNDKQLSIGYGLHEMDDSPQGIPTIPLFPYDTMLRQIETMVFSSQNCALVVPHTDVLSNEDFVNIIHSKAGVGASIWIPKIGDLCDKATEYAMSLTGTLLNIAKGDKVTCSIKDRIMYRDAYSFLVEFNVFKKSKKCSLMYYMMMLKFT